MDELREQQRKGAGDGGEQEAAEDFPADEDCVSGNVLVGKKPIANGTAKRRNRLRTVLLMAWREVAGKGLERG